MLAQFFTYATVLIIIIFVAIFVLVAAVMVGTFVGFIANFLIVVGRTCSTLAWVVWSTQIGSAILDDWGCSIRPCVRAFEENLLITSPTSHFTQLHFKRFYQLLSCIFSLRNQIFCQLFIFYRKCRVIATTRIDRRMGWSARRMELVDQWRLGFGGVSWLNAHDARACITMERNKNNNAS